MQSALTIAVVLLWVVLGVVAWLTYQVVRQYGHTLLRQDELRERLEAIEGRLQGLIDSPMSARLDAIERLVADRMTVPSPAWPASGAMEAYNQSQAPAPAPPMLPLLSPAPDFRLPDLQQRQRSLDEFLGKPLLLIFFNPACGYCMQMAPRLGQLDEDGPRVLVISRGDAALNRQMAAEHRWRCEVLLEPDWDVAGSYGAYGTPTGYLLDAGGRIASGLAAGADALLALLSAPLTMEIRSDQQQRSASHLPAAPTSNGHQLPDLTETLREKEQAAAQRARAAGLAVKDLAESKLQRDGLAVGTPAPDFTLPDLDGAMRSLAAYRGKRLMLIFSDPACGPCHALAPELEALSRQHSGDNLELLMVSRGDAATNRSQVAEQGLTFPVVLQKQWEISTAYAMFATPIAYLIGEDGIIAKDVAVGADAIRALL